MMLLRLCVLLFAAGYPFTLFAQSNKSDSAIARTAVENAANKALRAQKSINIGSEYKELDHSFRNGHHFFLSDKKITGSITYHDNLYSNVGLQYDLLLDALIVDHANGRKIMLVRENVSEFTIDGYVFRMLSKTDIDRRMTPGFYNIMAEGADVKLLAKRVKQEKQEKSTTMTYVKGASYLTDYTKYYIQKGNVFTEIKNYKNVKKILWDKKERPVIRKLKKTTQEGQMVNVVKQYISLKNEL